jgi:uncharacterized protein (TIGR02246 family)
MPAVDPTIDQLYIAWSDAFARADVDGVLSLVTPDYTVWYPEMAPLAGDQLRAALVAAFAKYEIESRYERVDCFVAGDLAVDCGWDVQVVKARGGGESFTRRQRAWVLLRRGDDGRWRFARGITQPGPK